MEKSQMELNDQSAYIKNNPIYSPDQLIKGKSIESLPIDKEWLDSLSDKFWCTNFKGRLEGLRYNQNPQQLQHLKDILALRDQLLSFGGEQACMPALEDDLVKIINRGQFWYGDKVDLMKGEEGQCHRNSCDLWENNKNKTVICTGYALNNDGMWRQHSWLVHLKPRVNRIVETTTSRIAYFGFAMTLSECNEFVMDNC